MSTNRAARSFLPTEAAEGLTPQAMRVLATVPAWWQRRAHAVGVRGRGADLFVAVASLPPVPAASLDELPPRPDLLDATAEDLGEAYAVALDSTVRNADGRHYTPQVLADALHTRATASAASTDGLVWDPAAGAGALLRPFVRSWLDTNAHVEPSLLLAGAAAAVGGRDLDPAAVWLGNALLAAELLPTLAQVPAKHRKPLPALLSVGDGLAPPPTAPRIQVLNPPYGRVRLTPEDRERWGHAVFGHANRYALFMAAAVEYASHGGVVSALVPAGWMGGSYFRQLRSYLGDTAPLRQLTYVTDRSGVFSTGVLQETVLATFCKGSRGRTVNCERLTMNGEANRERVGRGRLPKSHERPWLLPRSAEDVELVAAAQNMSSTLSDYGWKVSTGPLVWNRYKSQLSPQKRPDARPVIWAADLHGGELHRDRTRDELRYLQLGNLEHSVYVLDRPAVLVQRTTAPEQRRRLVAVPLDARALEEWEGQVVVENHVNVLTPEAPNSALTPRILTALLNSEMFDRLYRCVTGSVAVSAYELSALPLPDADTLRAWQELPDDSLGEAIVDAYTGRS